MTRIALVLLLLTTAGCTTLRDAARPEVTTSLPSTAPPFTVWLMTATGIAVRVLQVDDLPTAFTLTLCEPLLTRVSDGPRSTVPVFGCPAQVQHTFAFKALNRVTRVALYIEAR